MSTTASLHEHIQLKPPPWVISSGEVASTPMEPLGGSFAFQTDLKGRYLTAVGGGGRTDDVIHTDAGGPPRAWEEFTLWVDSATHQYYALQTHSGNFITAYNGGGLTHNAIDSSATSVNAWGMFKLLPQAAFTTLSVQTLRGFFLTAVGGGNHDSGDTIHTDGVNAAEWERFHIFRSRDLGTGSTYGIQAWGGGPVVNGFLTALDGGRQSGPNALLSSGGVPFWLSWTLLKHADGTYAFQTASGGVLTANGGGLPGEGFRTDTEVDMIGNWEKFTIEDHGDFTAYIKTHAGTYLTVNGNGYGPAQAVVDVKKASRWRFFVVSL